MARSLNTSLECSRYKKTLCFARKDCFSTLEATSPNSPTKTKKLTLQFSTIRRAKGCIREGEPYTCLGAQLRKLFRNTKSTEGNSDAIRKLNLPRIGLARNNVIKEEKNLQAIKYSYDYLSEVRKKSSYRITPQIKKYLMNVLTAIKYRFQEINKKRG
eukprot:TRINITY_DN7026_c0_g2_i4.p1 TRINITY_DN7026_c0_g2~~TRINITY_DN7026_c0_g2_i4.p1  ORF type:complete len:158 (-),score=10.81 TRINITY_DN7026_c0_g2_i4:276-749(-)